VFSLEGLGLGLEGPGLGLGLEGPGLGLEVLALTPTPCLHTPHGHLPVSTDCPASRVLRITFDLRLTYVYSESLILHPIFPSFSFLHQLVL
jgi:hypothetical protein